MSETDDRPGPKAPEPPSRPLVPGRRPAPGPSGKPRARHAIAPGSLKKPGEQLNVANWLEISNMAKEGVPVARIASMFGVTRSTIYAGLKKRGVRVGAYVEASRVSAASEARAELVEKIKKLKDSDYSRTEAMQQLVTTKIVEAHKAGRISAVYDDVRTLRLAIAAIRAGTDNKWKILGLDRGNEDTDKELPELPVRDLSEEETAAIRDRQMMEDAEGLSEEELEALARASDPGDLEDGEIVDEGDEEEAAA